MRLISAGITAYNMDYIELARASYRRTWQYFRITLKITLKL